MRTPLPRVPPPDRIYVYSPEIALRLAYIRKIHLYIFRRIGRSLLAATSRASRASLPIRVRPRVSLPTLPVDHMYRSMTTCTAVCLCDRVCRHILYNSTTSMPMLSEPLSGTNPTVPPPRVYRSLATRMAPRPRATTELPVSLQRTPQPSMTLAQLAATSRAPHA